MMQLLHFKHPWFFVIFLLCTALVLANVVHYVLFRILRRKEVESHTLGWGLQTHLGKPARAIFFITCLLIVLPAVPRLPDSVTDLLRQGFVMALIASIGWFAVGCVYVLQNIFLRRYDLNAENNIQARRVHTQFQLFRRMVISFIIVITAGALLWSLKDPRIWKFGTGLLASAGVASLILATAAKSTAANFLAGLQIALTEPIRIDDVVVVQGEWGRIEEINSAYVVIKIWDLRRLIVPLSYFIENSFQNWSREATDIMGTAFLYVDYSVPVEALRAELDRIVHPSPLWDKKVCGLQVTNLTDRTMELRCLMSSHNASVNFDLRCLVREQMTAFIQRNYPDAFPLTRFATTGDRDSVTGRDPEGHPPQAAIAS